MYSKAAVVACFLFLCATTSNAQILRSRQELGSDSTFRPYLIAFVVTDVEKTAEWYKEQLGFDIVHKLDFPQYDSLRILFMKLGEVELELIQKKTSFSIKKYVPEYDGFDKAPLRGIAKIAFWVHDVNTLASNLQARKVKFLVNLHDEKDLGIRSFIIEDLDGNVLQFNQRLQYQH